MRFGRLLLIGGIAALSAAPLSAAMADPWKDESGHGRHERRFEHRGEGRWSERDRWERDRHRDYERGRRAEHERRRAYEQGRADAYRDSAPRGPAEVLGQLLGR